MSELILVFISCKNKNEAEQIGQALLTKKLAACIQITNTVDSHYLWPPGKDVIEQSQEVLLLVKTLEAKWVNLEKIVIELHSYENPEILAMPVSHVTKNYHKWLTNEL